MYKPYPTAEAERNHGVKCNFGGLDSFGFFFPALLMVGQPGRCRGSRAELGALHLTPDPRILPAPVPSAPAPRGREGLSVPHATKGANARQGVPAGLCPGPPRSGMRGSPALGTPALRQRQDRRAGRCPRLTQNTLSLEEKNVQRGTNISKEKGVLKISYRCYS